MVESFWETPVDFDDAALQVEKSPFIVMEETPMSKIHFLFLMLGINSLAVVEEGVIVGIITKNEFIKKKKLGGKITSIKKKRGKRE